MLQGEVANGDIIRDDFDDVGEIRAAIDDGILVFCYEYD